MPRNPLQRQDVFTPNHAVAGESVSQDVGQLSGSVMTGSLLSFAVVGRSSWSFPGPVAGVRTGSERVIQDFVNTLLTGL